MILWPSILDSKPIWMQVVLNAVSMKAELDGIQLNTIIQDIPDRQQLKLLSG
jgi:hypothetical protein